MRMPGPKQDVNPPAPQVQKRGKDAFVPLPDWLMSVPSDTGKAVTLKGFEPGVVGDSSTPGSRATCSSRFAKLLVWGASSAGFGEAAHGTACHTALGEQTTKQRQQA